MRAHPQSTGLFLLPLVLILLTTLKSSYIVWDCFSFNFKLLANPFSCQHLVSFCCLSEALWTHTYTPRSFLSRLWGATSIQAALCFLDIELHSFPVNCWDPDTRSVALSFNWRILMPAPIVCWSVWVCEVTDLDGIWSLFSSLELTKTEVEWYQTQSFSRPYQMVCIKSDCCGLLHPF